MIHVLVLLQQGFSKLSNSLYFHQRFSKSTDSLYVPTRIFQTNKPLVCLVVEMFSFQSNEFFPPLKKNLIQLFSKTLFRIIFLEKKLWFSRHISFQITFLQLVLSLFLSITFPLYPIKIFFYFHVRNQTNQQRLVELNFVLRLLEVKLSPCCRNLGTHEPIVWTFQATYT